MTETATTPSPPRPASTGPGANPFPEEGRFPWYRFVAKTGEEGRRWVARYLEPDCEEMRGRIQEALGLLRDQRIAAGRELLERTARDLDRLVGPPALRTVMRRWLVTVRAYDHYLAGDFRRAAADLDRAQALVDEAVARLPALYPLALNCPELRFQHARVARAERRWPELARHLAELVDLAEDRRPLCRAGDGTPLTFGVLAGLLAALPGLGADELEFVAELGDQRWRRRSIVAFALQLYALPGLVIPYP